MIKRSVFLITMLILLALMGCNLGVPKATPDDKDDFLYDFYVATSHPTVGEEITIVATVTNNTGYDYWIKVDGRVFHFGKDGILYTPSKWNDTIKFSNHQTMTSTYTVKYYEAGSYQVTLYGSFKIDGYEFAYADLLQFDVV